MRGRLIAALGGAYLGVLAVKCALALDYVRRERRRLRERPGASLEATVVQPILSGDPRMEATLERNVRAIGEASFVWIVDESDAEGRDVCARVAARNRDRRIEIALAPQPGPRENPKLFKLERAWRGAATERLIVLDDDTVLSRDGYRALLGALDEYQLSTGLPSYASGANLPSSLVAQFVNDNGACTYLALCRVRTPLTINGMCYAIRKTTLAEMGGFAPLLGALADDLAVARAVLARGGRIYQTAWPHESSTTVRDWEHYGGLMHRWFLFATLLLERQPPATRAAIVCAYLLPPIALWSLLILAATSRSKATLARVAAALAVRELLLAVVRRQTLGARAGSPAGSLAAELLQPLHALRGAALRTIRWRTRRYRVRADDDFVELP